jgi:hypothetical protein
MNCRGRFAHRRVEGFHWVQQRFSNSRDVFSLLSSVTQGSTYVFIDGKTIPPFRPNMIFSSVPVVHKYVLLMHVLAFVSVPFAFILHFIPYFHFIFPLSSFLPFSSKFTPFLILLFIFPKTHRPIFTSPPPTLTGPTRWGGGGWCVPTYTPPDQIINREENIKNRDGRSRNFCNLAKIAGNKQLAQ